MRSLLVHLLALASTLTGLAAEPPPVGIPAPTTDWPAALPIVSPDRTLLVLDSPRKTLLLGYLAPWKQPLAATAPEIHDQAEKIIKTLPKVGDVELIVDWLDSEAPVNFQRTLFPTAGIARSRCSIAGATITRTVLVNPKDSSIFIHLLANKPGALSFRVSLDAKGVGQSLIKDRRQLVHSALQTDPASISAHVWVVPFESDVTPDRDSIIVRGEGEALILLTYAAGPQAAATLASSWKKLGDLYDPGQSPPNPAMIWNAVLGDHRKSIENSP